MGFIILVIVGIGMCGAIEIAETYFDKKAEVEKLRIRANLLKVGIDPDRLDMESDDK